MPAARIRIGRRIGSTVPPPDPRNPTSERRLWRNSLPPLKLRLWFHVHASAGIAVPWGPGMGPVEEKLEREIGRLWLLWRDEIIRAGITRATDVQEDLIAENAWDTSPHPRLDNGSPLSAVRAERRRRPM